MPEDLERGFVVAIFSKIDHNFWLSKIVPNLTEKVPFGTTKKRTVSKKPENVSKRTKLPLIVNGLLQ